MSERIWRGSRLKRLDFSRRSGNKIEYVFVGVLGLIIILSLFITFGGGSSRTPEAKMMELHLVCAKCQHEFTKPLNDLPKSASEMGMENRFPNGAPMVLLDCPQCKAKESCWLADQCPKCKKWYIPQTNMEVMRYRKAGRDIPLGVWQTRNKCSHCGTVPEEWFQREPTPEQ